MKHNCHFQWSDTNVTLKYGHSHHEQNKIKKNDRYSSESSAKSDTNHILSVQDNCSIKVFGRDG